MGVIILLKDALTCEGGDRPTDPTMMAESLYHLSYGLPLNALELSFFPHLKNRIYKKKVHLYVYALRLGCVLPQGNPI